jgi:hypothetical protein
VGAAGTGVNRLNRRRRRLVCNRHKFLKSLSILSDRGQFLALSIGTTLPGGRSPLAAETKKARLAENDQSWRA